MRKRPIVRQINGDFPNSLRVQLLLLVSSQKAKCQETEGVEKDLHTRDSIHNRPNGFGEFTYLKRSQLSASTGQRVPWKIHYSLY